MIRSVSYGGGVQSTALLVLAAEGAIPHRLFVHADVGADSENPETVAYVRDVAAPFAEAAGIELVTVRYTMRDGSTPTLLDHAGDGARMVIPIRWAGSGLPASRTCTQRWKIDPVARELKRRGATAEDPAEVALGISTDELGRVRSSFDPRNPEQRRVYPLVDLGLDREDCRTLILRAGVAEPPKSACWFCPFQAPRQWRRLRDEHPDRFAAAVELEERIDARYRAGRPERDRLQMRQAGPLRQLLDEPRALSLFASDDPVDDCDSGYCLT